MDESERAAIRDVLNELRRQGEREQRDARLGSDDPGIASPFKPLSERELEYLLHRPTGEFGANEVIRLVPPRREWRMVALWCRWSAAGPNRGCVFYLGAWMVGGGFLGFRFEPPGAGNHSYYHSQLCRSMGGGAPMAGALEVSERIPAWPLPAASSLELLLCLVLSIHGMNGLKEMRETFNDSPMQYRTVIRALDRVATLSSASAMP